MMQIKPEQYAAFERQAKLDFENRCVATLRSELPDLTADLSDDELRHRVQVCLPRAEQYGLEDEADVLAFVYATYLLDDVAFDTNPKYPWAQPLLTDASLTPEVKAEGLIDFAFAAHDATGE